MREPVEEEEHRGLVAAATAATPAPSSQQKKRRRASAAASASSVLLHATEDNSTTIADNEENDKLLLLEARIPVIVDRWSPQPSWSIAGGAPSYDKQEEALRSSRPLVSEACYHGLVEFFQANAQAYQAMIAAVQDYNSTAISNKYERETLSVVTESSSHPAGILSLEAQPWIWTAGGLGNYDECVSLNHHDNFHNNQEDDRDNNNEQYHVCLAGGTTRDALTFAAVCIVSSCEAHDLFADDFLDQLHHAAAPALASFQFQSDPEPVPAGMNYNNNTNDDVNTRKSLALVAAAKDYQDFVQEYITVHERIQAVGDYVDFDTGYVCGEYTVDWEVLPATLWILSMLLAVVCTIVGSTLSTTRTARRKSQHRRMVGSSDSGSDSGGGKATHTNKKTRIVSSSSTITLATLLPTSPSSSSSSSESSLSSLNSDSIEDNQVKDDLKITNHQQLSSSPSSVWSAFNFHNHITKMTEQRHPTTACLDGMKVLSLLWIITVHVGAIQGSTGAGWSNVKDFLPPDGFTTTLMGQLIFSSRFAVDTFLCISGYLAVTVLHRKFTQLSQTTTIGWVHILGVLVFRIVRIVPVYGICLGCWMYIAPHLGGGPFWYQWEHFLEPCRELWWTNFFFVNNFLPWGAPTESTCFYHSWYLAVDIQLFCLFIPWLVLVSVQYESPRFARNLALGLWCGSVLGTAVLAYQNDWSVNSFDGIAVGVFDVEGYAKPHVRAQSYLAGIIIAFWPTPPSTTAHCTRTTTNWSKDNTNNSGSTRIRNQQLCRQRRRKQQITKNNWWMVLALVGLTTLAFMTVTGAYGRRPCTFQESPFRGDDCGSLWTPTTNFFYTSFSRAGWSICVAIIMKLCLDDNTDNDDDDDDASDTTDNTNNFVFSLTTIVKTILSWKVWTPLAHLSFGSYLIHPIVIYVWFLGGRQKITFRLISYLMDVISITVVTYCASFIVTILIEFPCGVLLRPPQSISATTKTITAAEVMNIHDKTMPTETASLLESQSFSRSWEQTTNGRNHRNSSEFSDTLTSNSSYGAVIFE